MKKVFFAMFVFAAALGLVACNKEVVETEGAGYGLVHGHYVGEVNVTMKGDKITEMSIEEYFLPYNAGQLVAGENWATETPENVVKALSKGKDVFYAKYFYINGVVYTANVDEKGAISYLNGTSNIEDEVKDSAKAQAYVEAVRANKVFVIDSATATTKSTTLTVTGNAATAMTKSESGYWSGTNYPLGWKGNMAEIVKAMIETGVDATYEQSLEGFWATENYTSGATLADFLDYQNVAKVAVKNAK